MKNITDAIQVNKLSKRYRIGHVDETSDSLFGGIISFIFSPINNYFKLTKLTKFNESNNEVDVIWALKDISFNMKHGQVLGIIGPNGSGKSTLLKILAKITEPTTGEVQLNGRIASLLEVGTGFHPELTGRENLYLNGTILGMRKNEIDNKFDEIIEFSGINQFIDTPVKRYSSGMRVRLAFSIAAFLEPEILLIDEVLAVGDADFQAKCLGKMDSISKEGRTVLFVSHNMAAIKSLCGDAIVLNKGKLIYKGKSEKAVAHYLKDSNNKNKNNFIKWNKNEAPGDERLKIISVKFSPVKGETITIDSGIKFEFQCYTSLSNSAIDLTFHIYTFDGIRLLKTGILISDPNKLVPGYYTVTAELDPYILNKGLYNLHVLYGLSRTEKLANIPEFIQFEVFNSAVNDILDDLPGIIRPKFKFNIETGIDT